MVWSSLFTAIIAVILSELKIKISTKKLHLSSFELKLHKASLKKYVFFLNINWLTAKNGSIKMGLILCVLPYIFVTMQ